MTKETKPKSVFETLNAINVNGHTEKKKGGSGELTYLSWCWAWSEVKKLYPDASYEIYKDENKRPYIEDKDYGLMCYTTVTIEGQTHEMWLPVMNGANKAMKREPYKYQVWNNFQKKFEEKTVEAATMFDINKTIMRCLTKNLAMFGLGLYIYAGEDLPENSDEQPAPPTAAPAPAPKPADGPSDDELQVAFEMIKANIENAPSKQYLMDLHKQNVALHNYPAYKNAMNKRFKEVA